MLDEYNQEYDWRDKVQAIKTEQAMYSNLLRAEIKEREIKGMQQIETEK